MIGQHSRRDPRSVAEDNLQAFVVDLLRFNAVPGLIFYAIPNGEARSKATAAKLKRLGVRPGAGDLGLVLPGGHAAFLELKRPKIPGVQRGGVSSAEQRKFRTDCERNGALYAVAASPEEATEILWGWGCLRSAPPSVSRRTVEAGRAAAA